jgi:hypothetical protein
MLTGLLKKKVIINHEELLAEWVRNGRPSPPPHIVKQQALDEFRKKFNPEILVKTGTFLGEMVEAQRNNFKKIYSVELSEKLYRKAKKRFKAFSHIKLLQGDSGKLMGRIISEIDAPALFWLDGHYSGGITALGDKECPVPEELMAILQSNFRHVILIDDARFFNGTNDYPAIEEIESLLKSSNKNLAIEIRDDIIRITPYN